MAFSYPLNAPGVPYFYNVDFSVGARGYNRHEDILLVQALLRIFYYEVGFVGCEPPPGEGGIAVDGFYGPATQRHISRFQVQMIEAGGAVGNDGLFDPFRAPYGLSTLSKQYYALELLNDILASGCLQVGAENFRNLPHRGDVPQVLRSALKTVKTEATRHSGHRAPPPVPPAISSAMASVGKTLATLFKPKNKTA